MCGLLPWIPFNKSIIAIEGTSWINGIKNLCEEAFLQLKKQSRNLLGTNNLGGQHLPTTLVNDLGQSVSNPW